MVLATKVCVASTIHASPVRSMFFLLIRPLAINHQHIFPKRPVFKIFTVGPVLFSPEGDENLSNPQQPVHPRPVNYDISACLVCVVYVRILDNLLVVSIHLKNMRQIRSFPQVGVISFLKPPPSNYSNTIEFSKWIPDSQNELLQKEITFFQSFFFLHLSEISLGGASWAPISYR